MAERQWAEAATDFFEAFKNYDEAGTHRRIQCLKYNCQGSLNVALNVYIAGYLEFTCYTDLQVPCIGQHANGISGQSF